MSSERAPAQMSPLSKYGSSLDVRFADVSQGVLSYIDDYLRPAQKAKKIRNFHQFRRGMFSSGSGGWKRDCQDALNGGVNSTLGFGTYLDALAVSYPMVQVGNTLYNYDTVAHSGTAITGMTALSGTALPTIRPAAPNSTTLTPLSIYCNGDIEPMKLSSATSGRPTTAAALGFDNGTRTITMTVGGTITAGDTITLTFTSTSLVVSPKDLVYTILVTDTLSTVAAALVALINANLPTTSTVGITASSNAEVVTITYPKTMTLTATSAETGTITVTDVVGPTTPVFPGVFSGLTYTKPTFCQPFQSRMAYTRFARSGASGNAVVQQLLISALNDAELFTLSTPPAATDAWSVPIPPICGAPTALYSIQLSTETDSEVLIIGCQNGICVVRGTNATNFRLEIYTLSFGIPSNRTFVQIDNMVLFMATDGFRIYRGENQTSSLITSGIGLDIYDQFMEIDRTQWAKAHAVHHRDTQEIWFWVPYHDDGGNCKHAFIYNYNTLDGNPIWYNVDNTTCNASLEFNGTFYGGTELGLIQKWYGVNNYDDISGNVNRETVTLGGALSIGGILSVEFTGSSITGTPVTVSYTQVALDTTTSAALGLTDAINRDTGLVAAGISAIANANVVTIAYPTNLAVTFATATTAGFTIANAAAAATTAAQNILPGAEIVLSLVGVGNPAQFCSIRQTLFSCGAGDQRFLVNASTYEDMDDGSTRKQQMQPINWTLQSIATPQTVLGPASPSAWTLNSSAFPQENPKFLAGFVPIGHGRLWEFSIICNDSSHNCDFTGFMATISIGGMRI